MEDTVITNEQKPVENVEKTNSNWKHVAIGGVSGLLLGSATAAAATLIGKKSDTDNTDEGTTTLDGVDGTAQIDGSIAVAEVSDDLSFGDAFDAARDQVGAGGVFVWHGQVYSTYTAEEWDSMTPEQHAEFGSHMNITYSEPAQSAPQHHGPRTDNHADVAAEDNSGSSTVTTASTSGHATASTNSNATASTNSNATASTNSNDTTTTSGSTSTQTEGGQPEVEVVEVQPEVSVVSYETVTDDQGNQMDIAVLTDGNETIAIADVNMDGVADVALSDDNNNGKIEQEEIQDISGQNISMQSVHNDYLAQNGEGPDYINNADVDSYMA